MTEDHNYVKELVPDLVQWYEGNEKDMAFGDYMKAKIKQQEAFMAINKETKGCLGIIALSHTYNRITFLGISHTKYYKLAGDMLMSYALGQLNSRIEIAINLIKSNAEHINYMRELIKEYGFVKEQSALENGVPVDKMIKKASTS
ncbi:hypothetical protein HZI73_00515 [Vallitalea pronyensis]|uniref:Uncharacterized protein n=1 Tax=Vallitalea pronyensis TaxID=1348613 RepID=A0A8J8MFL6_9FIRM|nr:hypothetical protein [Vallitalea pronyensis]QUI20882.1 hypothetical protein HZI73_00515 [Vallitalea pronyensis]